MYQEKQSEQWTHVFNNISMFDVMCFVKTHTHSSDTNDVKKLKD